MAIHLIALVAVVTLHISSSLPYIEANKPGFSIELVSRDSPNSPLYKPEETPAQRLVNACQRSRNRARHFNSIYTNTIAPDTAQSLIIAGQGDYSMTISVGTPSFEIVAIADTGSDLIWTQCEPCTQCYEQTAPLFDPSTSSTYRDFSCTSWACTSLEQASCSDDSGVCEYHYQYGDRSFTIGNLASETLALGSTSGRPVAIPNAVFGCGHQNSGTFNPGSSGIVGLGGGPISLVSQMGSTISGKFSYCLVPPGSRGKNTSTLNFGSKAIVSGSGVQSTPLVSKTPETFYFLTLEAISVGSKRIEFEGSSFGTTEGNIIIDSGTTLTLLPQDFYSELESEVAKQVGGNRIDDPSGVFQLCYERDSGLKLPTLTAHFSGADIELLPLNTFIGIEAGVCFTFGAIGSGAIFGNLAQMNFLVGYDLQEKTVSFKPTDCSKSS